MDYKFLMNTTAPILIVECAAQGLVARRCNKAFCGLLHIQPDELKDRPLRDIYEQDESKVWLRRYESRDLALIHIDGRWYEVESVAEGDYLAFVHHDLTPQVDMESSLKRLQTRMKQIQCIGKIGDWEHNYLEDKLYWSEEVYRILGFTDRAFQPSLETFMRYVHPDDAPAVERAHAGIVSGSGYEITYRLRTGDGKTKWIFTKAKVDVDEAGVPIRVYGTIQDITQRRRLEQRVERAFHLAEDAQQSKGQFLALISHEVRTPLNGIMGMAQLMKSTNLDEEQGEYVEDILFSADALLNIVEDILEMSQLKSDRLEAVVEELDLHILLRNIVRIYQLKKSSGRVSFTHDIGTNVPQFVWGDATKIQQILINLLGNAFKYTDEGQINFLVSANEVETDRCRLLFEVSDTGQGIDIEKQATLFKLSEPGQEGLLKDFGSGGMGLYISKRYTDLMEGALSFESVPGKGSTFRFEVTLEKSVPLSEEKATSVANSRLKAFQVRVLVVGDDEGSRSYYESLLGSIHGFKTDYAYSLSTAVQMIEKTRYSFVILDMRLMEDSGIFTARTIREGMKIDGAVLPIIAVVKEGREALREAFETAGVNYFMTRPVHEAAFMGAVHQILDAGYSVKSAIPRRSYRYIRAESLRARKAEWGTDRFSAVVRGAVDGIREKSARIFAAVSPLNILVLSHEMDDIDNLVSDFGADDIKESMDLIKSALMNDDTAGIDVIVMDFMDEYECFVNELQDFLKEVTVKIEKNDN